MKIYRNLAIATTFGTALFVASCGSDSASTYDASKPSGIIQAVGTALTTVAGGLGSSSIVARRAFTTSQCDSHGEPLSGGSQMAAATTGFPGLFTYCKFTKNDGSPDTVRGAFETPRGVSCAVERAGIVFDGQPHTLTVTIDTNCFTEEQITNMGVSTFSATVTGSKPAAFNSYFDVGVRIQSTDLGIDYTLGTKVSGSNIEFVSTETGGSNESGAFAGSFNTSTGDLRYEGRMERINCSTSGRCGWNRHIRAYASTNVSGGVATGLRSVSFGYANISAPPGQSSYAGTVVTASGSPSSEGLKARVWTSSGVSAQADYDTIGNWTETTNTNCYTSSSDTATTCGTGLPLFSGNTHFLLRNSSHTSPTAFATSYAGMTFTSVDLSTDVQ